MGLNRVETRFCQWYNRLLELSKPSREFDLVQMSGILRLLMNESLWLRANERPNLDIKFCIIEVPQDLMAELSELLGPTIIRNDVSFIDPSRGIGNPKYKKDISPFDFLKLTAQIVDDSPVTVKEVISYGAHIQGGIHVGKPQRGDELVHTKLEKIKNISFGGATPSLGQLIQITNIILDGLKPLYDFLNEALTL